MELILNFAFFEVENAQKALFQQLLVKYLFFLKVFLSRIVKKDIIPGLGTRVGSTLLFSDITKLLILSSRSIQTTS